MERYPIRTASRPRPGTRRRIAASAGMAWLGAIAIFVVLLSEPVYAQQLPRPTAPTIKPRAAVPRGVPNFAAPPATPARRTPAPPAADAGGDESATIPTEVPEQPAPFQLTPQEEAALDAILAEWEAHSSQIDMFCCDIKRWEFDGVFSKDNKPKRVAIGELKYRAPDRGLYHVKDVQSGAEIEKWQCDGKAIYEFAYEKKELIKRTLPPELQGKAIANGPLPFIFSAKAETLKKRYFLRLKTPPKLKPQASGKEIEVVCLEAFPRFQSDAANFQRAELLLTRETMTPYALHLVMPNGKSSTDHGFYNIRTNDPIGKIMGDFEEPRTPLFWKKVIDPEEAPPAADTAAAPTTVPTPPVAPRNALRPQPNAKK